MPAQTPTERPSTTTSLTDRYASQITGGAYDAKSIQTVAGARMPIYAPDGASPSLIERIWTRNNFRVKTNSTDLRPDSLKFADKIGLRTQKYKP